MRLHLLEPKLRLQAYLLWREYQSFVLPEENVPVSQEYIFDRHELLRLVEKKAGTADIHGLPSSTPPNLKLT